MKTIGDVNQKIYSTGASASEFEDDIRNYKSASTIGDLTKKMDSQLFHKAEADFTNLGEIDKPQTENLSTDETNYIQTGINIAKAQKQLRSLMSQISQLGNTWLSPIRQAWNEASHARKDELRPLHDQLKSKLTTKFAVD